MVTSLAHHTNFTAGDLERFMGLSIGFDSMFNRLANFPQQPEGGTYPPYNIRKEDDYKFVIELALAGFSEKDVEVELTENVLSIRSVDEKGKQNLDTPDYVHRGIANRSFSRKFTLADDIVVRGAEFQNGLLNITLERVIPDEKKPRMIPITNPNVIEHKKK
jgi:molecular chaperone IbpA